MKPGDLVAPTWKGSDPDLRAEVLVAPGAFPWMGSAASVRLMEPDLWAGMRFAAVPGDWVVAHTAEERVAEKMMRSA